MCISYSASWMLEEIRISEDILEGYGIIMIAVVSFYLNLEHGVGEGVD